MTHSHVQHSLNMCVPFRALQPQIFSTLGLTQSGALLGTLTVSAVNFVVTIIAILAVDRCPQCPLWSRMTPSTATALLLLMTSTLTVDFAHCRAAAGVCVCPTSSDAYEMMGGV